LDVGPVTYLTNFARNSTGMQLYCRRCRRTSVLATDPFAVILDPAYAGEVVGAQDVPGDMPAKKTWLRCGDRCGDLCEIGIRMMLGEMLIRAPRSAGAGVLDC
jgi:hypothetical protein